MTRDIINQIAEERFRQIHEEGWSLERDRFEYPRGQLALAAACYAAGPPELFRRGPTSDLFIPIWPWSQTWWKPTTPQRNLVKAGALIVAELERLNYDGK